MKRIKPETLAKIWGCSPQSIRIGMQTVQLQIGQVIKVNKHNTYIIFFDKVREAMNVTREQLEEMLREVER